MIIFRGLSADRGSIELNYTGQNGMVSAMNHIEGQKTYDVPFIDVASYGAGMLAVSYFKISASTSISTKLWLQNTLSSQTNIVLSYFDLAGIPLLTRQISFANSEWNEINIATDLNRNIHNTKAQSNW